MYDWVTHTHSHLAGKCPHECSYCYVQRSRFGVIPRYQGEVRLVEAEFNIDYGSGKTIFIEHMNDLFANGVPDEFIMRILRHCHKFPDNQYVFQSKNPGRAYDWLYCVANESVKIKNFIMGTTMESNRDYMTKISQAPSPADRAKGIAKFDKPFVTIEPILDLDVQILVKWLKEINPCFVNIGADSKNCNLPEPTPDTVKHLVEELGKAGIVIRKKTNLGRMLE
jgi:hypothetical protein